MDLAAAAVVVAVVVIPVAAAAAAAKGAAPAAVAEQQNQDDDPPPVVAAAAQTIVITHKPYLQKMTRALPLIPWYSERQKMCGADSLFPLMPGRGENFSANPQQTNDKAIIL